MVTKVEFSQKTQNDFYGMSNTLELFQNASKGMKVNRATLESAWQEADTPDKKAVLMSILFSVGDVTARQHNIFGGNKVDQGGNSERNTFRDDITPFLVDKLYPQNKRFRLKLMHLITEYTVMDNILAMRVVTKKGTNRVQKVLNMVQVFGESDVAFYASHIILKGTVFQKICLSKFLTRPRFSKRSGKKTMLEDTKGVMSQRASLLRKVSKLAKLPFDEKGTYTDFHGYYNWRKQYNKDFESVLFSTGAIREMDKQEFLELLGKLPSDARFRVRNRVLFNEKWGQLKDWYQEWEKFKEDKQTEQRKLETRVEQGTASQEDKEKLVKVKKEAKVNMGAISFPSMYNDIIHGTVDKIKVQPFLDKVNLPYNSLTFIDDSGSMSWGGYNNFGFKPYQFAAFMAVITLMKNPDAEAKNLVGLFSGDTRVYTGIDSRNNSANTLLRAKTERIPTRPILDSNRHFLDNLNDFSRWLSGVCVNGSTNVSSIPEGVNRWVDNDPARLEEIQRYPIWTLISDGNFNNRYTSTASLLDFMKRCEKYFGFRPFLILIDVAGSTSASIKQFEGIDNVMMVPPNPANIEMFLTNFRDMDVYDVYTPLKSMFKSNRYAPVREFAKELF